jgi:hypothetical protein
MFFKLCRWFNQKDNKPHIPMIHGGVPRSRTYLGEWMSWSVPSIGIFHPNLVWTHQIYPTFASGHSVEGKATWIIRIYLQNVLYPYDHHISLLYDNTYFPNRKFGTVVV